MWQYLKQKYQSLRMSIDKTELLVYVYMMRKINVQKTT